MEKENFLQTVDTFLKIAKETNEEIINLTEGIESLSDNVGELKKIENLNTCLEELNKNIMYIDECNKKLSFAFNDIDKISNLETSLNDASQKFIKIENLLKSANTKINELLHNEQGMNLEMVRIKINEVNVNLKALNEYVSINLVQAIENDLCNNVDSLKDEIDKIKRAFAKYQEETKQMIKDLKNENSELIECLKNNLSTNREMIELFKEIKEKNINTETFLNDFINKWYDENATIFGRRKK